MRIGLALLFFSATPTFSKMPHAFPDLMIDGFTVERLIGAGAMGHVYLAQQQSPQRQVALKLLSRTDRETIARFRREANLLARLEHPNIARIYDTGETTIHGVNTPWIAMEYVEGSDLRTHCESALPDDPHQRVTAVLQLIHDISRGVQAAHTKGVIHRDLKPANIHVTPDGVPKILDFGLAQVIGDEALTAMTRDGEILGTVPYMSWEQLTGNAQQIDGRSDLYSLGAVTYELICGQSPYPGLSTTTLVGAVERLGRENPRNLRHVAPAIPKDLGTLVMKALAREPEQRYATVGDFAAEIERFLKHEPIKARPPSATYLVRMFVQRHRGLSAALLLAAVSLASATGISIYYSLQAKSALGEAQARLAEREAVADFLTQMIRNADPSNLVGGEISIRKAIQQAALEHKERQSELDPDSEAQLQVVLAELHTFIGDFDDADYHLKAAEDAITASAKPDVAVTQALVVARAIHLLNTEQFSDVEPYVEKHIDQVDLLTSHKLRNTVALANTFLQNFDEAIRQFLSLLNAKGSVPSIQTVEDYWGLVFTYRLSGKQDAFKDTAEKAIRYAVNKIGN